jgi:hypothetical protein
MGKKRPDKTHKYGGMTSSEVERFREGGMSDDEIVDLSKHINNLRDNWSVTGMAKKAWRGAKSMISGKEVPRRYKGVVWGK